ncbi:MAG: hypothetical protein WC383_15275 [Gammaproteobacteria bacterium]
MANLTIVVPDDLLKKARMRAISQNTSVNAQIRRFLEQYAGIQGEREDRVKRLLELSRRSKATSGGRRWVRDELHER